MNTNGQAASSAMVTHEEPSAIVVSRETAFENYKRGLEPTGIDAAYKVAAAIAATGYCGVGSPEEALARIMFGRELGLTLMNSMRAVYVVNGRPGLDANVMHALCLQSPACEYFEMVETTKTVATYRAKRRGREEVRLSWTIEQAKDAGLLGGRPGKDGKTPTVAKDNWQNYPENMLRARCIANLARIVFPEAINGMHTAEELETSTVPTPVVIHGTAHEAQLIAPTEAAFEKKSGELHAMIQAATTKAEQKAVRNELVRLGEKGELPNPWLASARALYNEKFGKKEAAPATGSNAEATPSATASASPPAPATDTKPAAAAPPAPPPSDEEIDRGDNPDKY